MMAHKLRPIAAIAALYSIFIIIAHQQKIPPFYPVPSNHDISSYIPAEDIKLEGVICSYPEYSIDHYGKTKARFIFNPRKVIRENVKEKIEGLAEATIYNPPRVYEYGDYMGITGKLSGPFPATNPGQFDYRGYLARQGIFTLLSADASTAAYVLKKNCANPLLFYIFQLRNKLEGLIDADFSLQDAALLNALLLGKRAGVEYKISDAFVKTGTAHILAISGLHVGIIAFILLMLLKAVRIAPRPRYIIAIILLAGYAALAGGRPSVERAAVMAAVFLTAMLLERESDIYNSLSIAALAILCINPRDLFDIGFQLSFASVISIVYISPRLEKIICKESCRGKKGDFARAALYLKKAFIVSASALLGSAPLVAYYFNVATPVALIANIIIVPLVSVVVACGIAFLMAGLFFPFVAFAFQGAAFLSVWLLKASAGFLSKLPLAYFYLRSPGVINIIVYYFLLLAILNHERLRLSKARLAVILFSILNIFIWSSVFVHHERPVSVTFLDTGAGDSIYIDFQGAKNILIDTGEGGQNDAGRFVILPYLRSLGVNRLDSLILTHPHSDHIGGAETLINNFKVANVLDNGFSNNSMIYHSYESLVKKKSITHIALREYDRICGYPDAEIIILGPKDGFMQGTDNDINNNSIALKMICRGKSILFMGDLEEAGIESLLKYGELLKSDIIKIPHHGSRMSGAMARLLDLAKPEIAVISAPRKGRFDFPSKEFTEELKSRGISLYVTKDSGAIKADIYSSKCGDNEGGEINIKTYYND